MDFETFEEEYKELEKQVVNHSEYQRKGSADRKWMTVPEMGKMLGLKKTERYWLLHKGFFESRTVLGKMWVNIESFEKWYANQVKYKKVNGEEPGKELKERSYSPQELAELLGVSDSVVYDLLIQENIEVIKVDYWKRIPKAAFEKWYRNQTRYRTKEDREKDAAIESATISMPEMARLLGIERKTVYGILANEKYKDIFEYVIVADRKRITKESFQKFLEQQNRYRLDTRNDYKEVALEDNVALANFRRKKLFETGIRKGNGNQQYLTRDEAALLAKTSRTSIYRYGEKGCYPVIKVGEYIRIPRKEFEDWLNKRMEETT